MRRARYVIALAGLLAMVGCSNMGQPINTPNAMPVCIAMGGVNARIDDFQALDPATASAQDFQTAAIQLNAAYQTLDAQIRVLADAQATQLQGAMRNLQNAAQALPAGTTPQDAKAQLADEIAAVDSAMESARAQLNCPPFPTPQPQ